MGSGVGDLTVHVRETRSRRAQSSLTDPGMSGPPVGGDNKRTTLSLSFLSGFFDPRSNPPFPGPRSLVPSKFYHRLKNKEEGPLYLRLGGRGNSDVTGIGR